VPYHTPIPGEDALTDVSFTNGLTDSQKKAVAHKDGPLLVLAGPGSGKTRVITCRVAALVRAGVRPWNICAITFTNKAADEMRRRVESMQIPSGAHISTFHSLCVRLLRRYAQAAGIRADFSIYDEDDQKHLLRQVLKSADVDAERFPPARLLGGISRCKNDLEDHVAVAARADDYYTKALAKAYRLYQQALDANNALDFDDLLLRTAFLLRDRPEVRRELGEKFRYLLVDEYQDTNHAQYEIARGLALDHGNLCVTGDPDQSIYRWRGADIGNILAFERDWPNAVVIRLEENFRSRPQILALADELIANNRRRKQKKLIPTRPDAGRIEFHTARDESDEACFVAEQIRRLIGQGATAGDIAVFYRINAMSRAIEEAFITRQIPYQVVRGVEFYARKEIRDVLGYLRLIANPKDDVAFARAVNSHSQGIGKTTLERLAIYAGDHNISLDQAAREARNIPAIAAAAQQKLAAFAALIEKFRRAAEGPVAPFIKTVFEESGYARSLEDGTAKDDNAVENVGELISAAAEYDKTAESPSLLDWLQEIALYSDTDAYDAESGRVSLMTLHAAKGLEFGSVFIIGLEEGILPHERARDGTDDLEEERRLCFVGITRARDNLTITRARYRTIRGQFLATIPSQFLFELGRSEQDDGGWQDDGEEQQDAEEPDEPIAAHRRRSAPVFRVNDVVRHGIFGRGRVKQYLDLGDDSVVTVRFDSGQTKSLALKYAKLEKAKI